MLVTRILGDCPGCGRVRSFGNVNVFGGNKLLRGCGYCKYSEQIPLPSIQKKILYLDQFFFSHAFRGGERRFVDAAERIQAIAAEQLLAAPYSSLHEQETLLWSRHHELREFIKEASRGAKFASAFRVECTQVARAFQAWLAHQSPQYVLEERDAIDRDVHHWDGYFRIDVALPPDDPALIRAAKQQSVDGLVDLFDDWRVDTTTFEEDLALEYAAAGKGYLQAYLAFVARAASGDYMAFVESPVMSMVVETLMGCQPRTVPAEDRLQRCAEFFASEHFKNVPSQWLSTRIFVALKAMVKAGSYTNAKKAKKRLSGFFLDVNHIATYAPYCDAIIVDQSMAELVARPEVALEQTFSVKVFSLHEWDRLFAWMDEIEATASDEHNAALSVINAEGIPFRPAVA